MKLAIQGCSHGELTAIYASVLRAEAEKGIKVDALLLCGDFQAVRNHSDLNALAVPSKYRQLGSFHSYYSGQLIAPLLTLVIGGNHEASNYMHELYHGGWLAPNIYYLGAAGAVDLGGLTVAGISGIYKRHDYKKGRFETVPYDGSSIRSCYHTRVFDVERLKQMRSASPDIVMSHDWPNTIERWGDTASLIRRKPFFAEEIESKTLGSPPLLDLLKTLKPNYWFSAHLHVKFAAVYPHSQPVQALNNPESIDINVDSDLEDEAPQTTALSKGDGVGQVTRFLALHKCVPHSDFLQFIDVDAPEDNELQARKASAGHQQRIMPSFRYNKRWLAVTKAFHSQFSLAVEQPPMPVEDDASLHAQIAEAEQWIDEKMAAQTPSQNQGKRKQDDLDGLRVDSPPPRQGTALNIHVVQQFIRTAPAPSEPGGLMTGQPAWYTNPQTESFCRFLGIENKINPRPPLLAAPYPYPAANELLHADPNALNIELDGLTDEEAAEGSRGVTTLLDDDELNARWKEGTG